MNYPVFTEHMFCDSSFIKYKSAQGDLLVKKILIRTVSSTVI